MGWLSGSGKSAGITVNRATLRAIRKADAARARKDWKSAAQHYAAAVADRPDLYHIWVQLGHAEREAGHGVKAEHAYRRAVALRPASGEPFLHIGHMHKLAGQPTDAARSYLEALRRENDNSDALREITFLFFELTEAERLTVQSILTALAISQGSRPEQVTPELAPGTASGQAVDRDEVSEDRYLVFDVSDLVNYFRHARLPTGIQRVQIETINGAAARPGELIKLCCFMEGREDWLEVPMADFLALTALSALGADQTEPRWNIALGRLYLGLALSHPFVFPRGSYLINLGTSWWLQNYFLYVRHAKRDYGIRYIPLVFDLIPIIFPQHCIDSLVEDFISWIVGVFQHADGFLAISEATKRDLLRVAAILGHDISPDRVSVVRLDADPRRPGIGPLPSKHLRIWRLEQMPFVLFVSTIESRKGHAVALAAWTELLHRQGRRRTPMLVCVGRDGWLNESVHRMLQQDTALTDRVMLLHGVADDELDLLYRSCLFTIYPSLYEGWGLPITEALCHGKAVITADNSSLPEAGGAFATIIESGSSAALVDAVEAMIINPENRRAIEANIAREFTPRRWEDVADQIRHDVLRLVLDHAEPTKVIAKPVMAAYHPITRNRERRIWPGLGSGEIFRAGLGWLWPGDADCPTRPGGGQIRMRLPCGAGAMNLCLVLTNRLAEDCGWQVWGDGLPEHRGRTKSGVVDYIDMAIPAEFAGRDLTLLLRGDEVGLIQLHAGSHLFARGSISLCGFFIAQADDQHALSLFRKALLDGDPMALSAYRIADRS